MVRSTERTLTVLAGIMSLLALADGVLHFALDFVLFRGNIFGAFGPRELPLALNQLFALNLVGYVVLVLVLWFAAPRLGGSSWLVNVLFMIYIALVVAGWLRLGAPNPMGLGYLSKGLELVLVLVALARIWIALSAPRGMPRVAPQAR